MVMTQVHQSILSLVDFRIINMGIATTFWLFFPECSNTEPSVCVRVLVSVRTGTISVRTGTISVHTGTRIRMYAYPYVRVPVRTDTRTRVYGYTYPYVRVRVSVHTGTRIRSMGTRICTYGCRIPYIQVSVYTGICW